MILQVGGLKRTILFPPKKIALLFTHGFNQHHSLKTLETVVGRLGLMNHHQQPEKLVRCWNHPGCHSKTSSKWENDRRATPILKIEAMNRPSSLMGDMFFLQPLRAFFFQYKSMGKMWEDDELYLKYIPGPLEGVPNGWERVPWSNPLGFKHHLLEGAGRSVYH